MSLPIVFSDGDRQTDVGTVTIHPSLTFKAFQAAVAHRIGLAPHQISTSLVRRKKARAASPDLRRKLPIDESTDFSALSRERDCFILALLRRSPRRSRKNPEKLLLRRPPPADPPLGLGLRDYGDQLRDLQLKRERYLLATAARGSFYANATAPAMRTTAAVCEVCEAAKEEGHVAGFHWCVYDAVTVGFRSPVGPIERPSKKRVGVAG